LKNKKYFVTYPTPTWKWQSSLNSSATCTSIKTSSKFRSYFLFTTCRLYHPHVAQTSILNDHTLSDNKIGRDNFEPYSFIHENLYRSLINASRKADKQMYWLFLHQFPGETKENTVEHPVMATSVQQLLLHNLGYFFVLSWEIGHTFVVT